ncbi:MAG: response regulator [Caldisericia bacterium]|nr:response regulator [Caldisericia bacterium]
MEKNKMKIVAIDDNADNLFTIEAIVDDVFPEAELETALSGLEGIEKAREMRPDVILLDILMPGLTGFETCELMKNDPDLCNIPVIFLTALKANRKNRFVALDVGADGFLTKPLDEIELTAQIKTMVKIKIANDMEKNEKIRLTSMVREKTKELENTSAELRKSKEEYVKLFNNMVSGISLNEMIFKDTVAKDYRIISVNPAYAKMVGVPENEIVNKLASNVFADSVEQKKHFNTFISVANTGKAEVFETFNERNHKHYRVTTTCPKKGQFANNFVDITEKKQTEEIKDHFVNMVSHELRTPLTSIHNGLILLSNTSFGNLSDEQKNILDISLRNADRLTKFVNDVLDYQRIRNETYELNIEATDISIVIDEAIDTLNSLAEERGLTLSSQIEHNIPLLNVDREQIRRLLINIVSNAIKYTDKGSIVVKNSFNSENNSIILDVEDTGIGIKPEDIGKLFSTFTKINSSSSVKRPKSSGLGLSISKEIIDLHGGRIWVDSKLGVGSTFHIEIPIEYKQVS